MMNYDDNDKALWAKNGKILEKIEKVLVIWKAAFLTAFLQSLKPTKNLQKYGCPVLALFGTMRHHVAPYGAKPDFRF